MLVQQEELEAFLGVHNDLMNAPFPFQQPHRHILLALDAIHRHMDGVEDYMSHMESSCRFFFMLMSSGKQLSDQTAKRN